MRSVGNKSLPRISRIDTDLFYLNKNTASMMPTKILINIPMVILVVDVATRHLSWLVYLSSVQANLTSDSYPTHYGCKCILLPIVFKWSQPRLIIMETSHRLNTLVGFWHSRSAIGSHWLLTLSTLRRPMPPLSPLTHEVRGDPIMYMWCINLFTHLVHLPAAYASKTYPMNIRFA